MSASDDDKTVMVEIPIRDAPPRARLVCENPEALRGSQGVEIDLVYGDVTVGRGRDNVAVINADGVSTSHARLLPAAVGWIVEDLESANAVLVNDTPIPGPSVLEERDVITLGVARYRYELRPEEEPGDPAAEEPEDDERTKTVYLSSKKAAGMAAPTPAPESAVPPPPATAESAEANSPGAGARIWIVVVVVVLVVAAVAGYLALG